MPKATEKRNGMAIRRGLEAAEFWLREPRLLELPAPAAPPVEADQQPPASSYDWAADSAAAKPRDGRPALALFCYETPDSIVGQFVGSLAEALARRQRSVHLFSRCCFHLETDDVTTYVLGEGDTGDLIDQVQEFNRRAANAFLKQFPTSATPAALLGCEWSAAPALSLLRGIKQVPTLLSVHSLERQRNDLSSAISKRIDEIELTGLREARTVLLHAQATAEGVKYAAAH